MPNKNGVCVIAFKIVSIEQTTSNAANIIGSIRREVLNTQKKTMHLRSLSGTMSLSVSSRGSDFYKAIHCKS